MDVVSIVWELQKCPLSRSVSVSKASDMIMIDVKQKHSVFSLLLSKRLKSYGVTVHKKRIKSFKIQATPPVKTQKVQVYPFWPTLKIFQPSLWKGRGGDCAGIYFLPGMFEILINKCSLLEICLSVYRSTSNHLAQV